MKTKTPYPYTLIAALGFGLPAALTAVPASAVTVTPVLETPAILEPGDADDPAFWLNPVDSSKSYVITTAKNAGLRVYDLNGSQLQAYLNPNLGSQRSRLNNVDVQYNFKLADGTRTDVAVFTDRGQDTLRIFKVNESGDPLTEITTYNRLFPSLPVSQQSTGYGLALWRDVPNDTLHALVTQRSNNVVAQFKLVPLADGTVTTEQERSWTLPSTYKGVDLTQDDYSPQSEGLVVDQQTGILYVGQEDVGIWKIDLKTGTLDSAPLVETRYFDPTSPIAADVEGLTIRYGANGEGVIFASSQGDNTFAAFDRQTFDLIGTFDIGAILGIDAVQESDGADVTSFALPGFEYGLFVTQDGYNDDDFDGDDNSNFKFVSYEGIAAALGLSPALSGFDPRNPVPEPSMLALMALGFGLLGRATRRAAR